jgi:hypothetical protein
LIKTSPAAKAHTPAALLRSVDIPRLQRSGEGLHDVALIRTVLTKEREIPRVGRRLQPEAEIKQCPGALLLIRSSVGYSRPVYCTAALPVRINDAEGTGCWKLTAELAEKRSAVIGIRDFHQVPYLVADPELVR